MFKQIFRTIEDSVDRVGEGFEKLIGQKDPLVIKCYAGFGDEKQARIRGRVLARQEIPAPGAQDSEWRNVVNMTKRWLTDEVPNAHLSGTFRGETVEAVTDEEGYFVLDFQSPVDPLLEGLWAEAQLVLINNPEVKATGTIQVPAKDANYGIISDIDDTVLHTGATNFLKMVRTTLTGNALTRTVFEGVSDFYAQLQKGSDGQKENPFFYVTSSPWNLYDLLLEIFEKNVIPQGSLFMKDWGIDDNKFLTSGHQTHKLDAIEEVIEFFPEMKFILIGDSGQEDPEIYAEVLARHPKAIIAAYIRDVTVDTRDAAVQKLAAEARESTAELLLIPDTSAAVEHARTSGFIV